MYCVILKKKLFKICTFIEKHSKRDLINKLEIRIEFFLLNYASEVKHITGICTNFRSANKNLFIYPLNYSHGVSLPVSIFH